MSDGSLVYRNVNDEECLPLVPWPGMFRSPSDPSETLGPRHVWCSGQHVCFPCLPPMLQCGFDCRLGLEFPDFRTWHFPKLVVKSFLRVLRFAALLHRLMVSPVDPFSLWCWRQWGSRPAVKDGKQVGGICTAHVLQRSKDHPKKQLQNGVATAPRHWDRGGQHPPAGQSSSSHNL